MSQEIDETFEPELIIRASKADKAKARRKRSAIPDDEPTGSPWKKFVGVCMMGVFGLLLFAVVVSWFEMQRTSRMLGMFLGKMDTTSQTMEMFVLAAIFGAGAWAGLKLFQSGSATE